MFKNKGILQLLPQRLSTIRANGQRQLTQLPAEHLTIGFVQPLQPTQVPGQAVREADALIWLINVIVEIPEHALIDAIVGQPLILTQLVLLKKIKIEATQPD